MENNKGITLVALIITIVVMLILVAVSVNVLIKSNLIGIAEKTADKYNKVAEEEGNSGTIEIGGKKYNSIEDYIKKNGATEDENLPDIAAGVRADKDSNYNGVTIPKGFTVSGITEEQNKDNGLVIYDIPQADLEKAGDNFWTETTIVGTESYPKVQCNYNQFVWIPVEVPYVTKAELDKIMSDSKGSITTEQTALQSLADSGKYPMAVQLANGIDYRGILYDFTEGTNKVNITAKVFSTTDSYSDTLNSDTFNGDPYNREPAKLNSTLGNVDQTEEEKLDLQTEYNNIVKSVGKQKGFWVARYELSHSTVDSTNKAESKRGRTVSNAGSSSLSKWYGLYSTCKNANLQSGTGMQSSMIYGSQWDQIMIWLKDVKNTKDNSKFYILYSSYMGNYDTSSGGTGKAQVSGYKDDYEVKQIFDLGGNLLDWTTEANGVINRVSRGLRYNSDGSEVSASYRLNGSPASRTDTFSTRFTLYTTT